MCEVLGEPDLAARPGFGDGRERLARREEVRVEVERLLAARGARDWIPALRQAGIPAGPVYAMDQVFTDPQVQALQMVQSTTTDTGRRLDLVRGPVTVDGVPPAIRRAPPSLGQDSRDVLRGIEIPEDEIDALVREGVIGT